MISELGELGRHRRVPSRRSVVLHRDFAYLRRSIAGLQEINDVLRWGAQATSHCMHEVKCLRDLIPPSIVRFATTAVRTSGILAAAAFVRAYFEKTFVWESDRLRARPATEDPEMKVSDCPNRVNVEQFNERFTHAPAAVRWLECAY